MIRDIWFRCLECEEKKGEEADFYDIDSIREHIEEHLDEQMLEQLQ